MSESVQQRLLREMRQSPGKAAVLVIGAIAAAFVWGPRLAASARSTPAPGSAGATVADDRSLLDPDGRRDPAAIRGEFIRISEEARALRELAEPVEAFPIDHDPFAATEEPIEVARAAPPARTERDEEQDRERESVAQVRLSAVFRFPRGNKAVVDGEVLAVGDRVAGFEVMEIAERSVVLGGRFGTYRIAMSGGLEER